MTAGTTTTNRDAWQALPLDEWLPTYATLHRWTQIVGKTRLRLAPFENHWWHCTLYVTACGLTTSPMPYRGGVLPGGVRVYTEESWSGPAVEADVAALQAALDASLVASHRQRRRSTERPRS